MKLSGITNLWTKKFFSCETGEYNEIDTSNKRSLFWQAQKPNKRYSDCNLQCWILHQIYIINFVVNRDWCCCTSTTIRVINSIFFHQHSHFPRQRLNVVLRRWFVYFCCLRPCYPKHLTRETWLFPLQFSGPILSPARKQIGNKCTISPLNCIDKMIKIRDDSSTVWRHTILLILIFHSLHAFIYNASYNLHAIGLWIWWPVNNFICVAKNKCKRKFVIFFSILFDFDRSSFSALSLTNVLTSLMHIARKIIQILSSYTSSANTKVSIYFENPFSIQNFHNVASISIHICIYTQFVSSIFVPVATIVFFCRVFYEQCCWWLFLGVMHNFISFGMINFETEKQVVRMGTNKMRWRKCIIFQMILVLEGECLWMKNSPMNNDNNSKSEIRITYVTIFLPFHTYGKLFRLFFFYSRQ